MHSNIWLQNKFPTIYFFIFEVYFHTMRNNSSHSIRKAYLHKRGQPFVPPTATTYTDYETIA